jgi:hypothetical protein
LLVKGCLPQIIDVPGAPLWHFAEKFLTDDIVSPIPAPFVEGVGKEALLVRRFRKEDGSVDSFIFNRSDLEFEGSFEKMPLRLAPGESILESEITAVPVLPEVEAKRWNLHFCAPNSVPLTFWEWNGGQIELFSRSISGTLPVGEDAEFRSCFLAAEGFKVMLTVEEDMLKRGRFAINGTVVENFSKAAFRDCRELECDITSLLHTSRSPLLNTLSFTGAPFLGNPPYLRGTFKAAVPHGKEGFPVLSAAAQEYSFTEKADFREFGYGTYSGKALCSAETFVPETGIYLVKFAHINDSAKLIIDGKDQGIRIAPPYCWQVVLEAGRHKLELEICNNSGNRDRNLGLPAGIIL